MIEIGCPRLPGGLLVALPLLAAGLIAEGQAGTQPAPRPLPDPTVFSAAMFGAVTQVRALSDGRVIVNDGRSRRLVLLDQNLRQVGVILDSVAGGDRSYGGASSTIVAHTGDSTLFIDDAAQVFLVIDPAGRIARVTPLPPARPQISALKSLGGNGRPAVAPGRGLVFQMSAPTPPGAARPVPGTIYHPSDTNNLLAFRLDARTVDTIARFVTGRSPPMKISPTGVPLIAEVSVWSLLMQTADGWAVMSDGTIAIVRGREYRVEWIGRDGTRSQSPPLPFSWRRNTEGDKAGLVDSLNALAAQTGTSAVANWLVDSAAMAARGVPASILAAASKNTLNTADVNAAARSVCAGPPVTPRPQPIAPVSVDDIPEYLPVLDNSVTAVFADMDNNLWLRTRPGGAIFGSRLWEVISRDGAVIDRLEAAANRTLLGFGPGGAVYVQGCANGMARLERIIRR